MNFIRLLVLPLKQQEQAPGTVHATVDLGDIHLAAVTTNTGKAMIVTGRGIRSLKRQRTMQLRQITKKQARCMKYSPRWKTLQRAKNKQSKRAENRIRNQRHQATRQVITFCIHHPVGTLFIGNPHGIRNRNNGRHHNQRMALWEYGKDIDYLTHKSKQAHSRASLAPNEEQVASVPHVGINISQETDNGTARSVVLVDIETLKEVSICIACLW